MSAQATSRAPAERVGALLPDQAAADDRDTVLTIVPPSHAAIRGHDAAQRVDVGSRQLVHDDSASCVPRIPDGADQLAGDAVAERRAEEHASSAPRVERRAAFRLLLDRAVVERLADAVRPRCEHLVQHARVQRAGRDGVDVDAERRGPPRPAFR